MVTILAILQGVVGVLIAKLIGAKAWLSLICGPAALSGGHGNAAAYSGILEEMGYSGATVVGMAAATFGLVTGGFFGGPLAKMLIKKHNLVKKTNEAEDAMFDALNKEHSLVKTPVTIINIIKHLALLLTFLIIGLYMQSLIKTYFNISA